jgi:hypothetical protein
MAVPFALVAHQGGWDEIMLVGGPILIIVAVLAIAKKRVDKLHAGAAEAAGESNVEGTPSA